MLSNELLNGVHVSISLLNSPYKMSLRKVMHTNEVLSMLCTAGFGANKMSERLILYLGKTLI